MKRTVTWTMRIDGMPRPVHVQLSFDADLPWTMPAWADGPVSVEAMLTAIQVIALRKLGGQLLERSEVIEDLQETHADQLSTGGEVTPAAAGQVLAPAAGAVRCWYCGWHALVSKNHGPLQCCRCARRQDVRPPAAVSPAPAGARAVGGQPARALGAKA